MISCCLLIVCCDKSINWCWYLRFILSGIITSSNSYPLIWFNCLKRLLDSGFLEAHLLTAAYWSCRVAYLTFIFFLFELLYISAKRLWVLFVSIFNCSEVSRSYLLLSDTPSKRSLFPETTFDAVFSLFWRLRVWTLIKLFT